jgi:predicted flap endonuclease-1-like 5' DNA nuclease
MDPETWHEQAALAAAGKTAEMKAFQQQLKGGKRRQPDHLTMIEGIGPKIESILVAQGITTFSQLAATDVATLHGILKTANLRLADPTTWPEQARLAAAHKMDDLRALQSSLKGGRQA